MSMQSILSASLSLTQIQTVQSANTKVQGRINVLKAEIKQDNGNEKKEEEVKGLEEQSSKLMDDLMGNLEEVNSKLDPSKEEDGEKTGGSSSTGSNTDKVDLSHKTDGEASKDASSPVQNAEPTVYQANGEAAPQERTPSGARVNTRV